MPIGLFVTYIKIYPRPEKKIVLRDVVGYA